MCFLLHDESNHGAGGRKIFLFLKKFLSWYKVGLASKSYARIDLYGPNNGFIQQLTQIITNLPQKLQFIQFRCIKKSFYRRPYTKWVIEIITFFTTSVNQMMKSTTKHRFARIFCGLRLKMLIK